MEVAEDEHLVRINRLFGKRWSIWQTHDETGAVNGWWAIRRGRLLTTDEMFDELMHQVSAATGREFLAVLVNQDHIDALLIEERLQHTEA